MNSTTESSGCKAPEFNPPVRWKVWTMRELVEADLRLDYIVKGVLVAGQPCVIGGPSKCLKTSIACDLAVSVATGSPFLGRFAVDRPLGVAVFSAESQEETLKSLLLRIAESRDLELGDAGKLRLICDVPRCDDKSQLAEVDTVMQATDCKVLLIDPAYLAMGGDGAENVFKQGERLRAIGKIAGQHKASVVLLHHLRKGAMRGDASSSPTLDDLAWSGFGEWARQWILISRRGGYRVGSGLQRLRLSIGGSAGHQGEYGIDVDEGTEDRGRRWSVAVLTEEELEREHRRRDDRRARAADDLNAKVLSFLVSRDAPATATDISNAVGASRKRIAPALEKLEASGTIISTTETRGKSKQQTKVYGPLKAA